MTIDLRRLSVVPLVLTGWIAVLALVMRIDGSAPAALVILPPDGLLQGLPDGVAVLSETMGTLTLSGPPGLVATLYKAGALLVLPAGLVGCLPGP